MDLLETEPAVPVVITPTVPISCPPCSVTVRLARLIGITVSACSVTFYTTDQLGASRTIYVRAVPTAGCDPRYTEIQFRLTSTEVSGTGWDRYSIPNIPVSIIEDLYEQGVTLVTGGRKNVEFTYTANERGSSSPLALFIPIMLVYDSDQPDGQFILTANPFTQLGQYISSPGMTTKFCKMTSSER